jgi:diguanylate cyclase (GGDEF)-like protein/PAS domain S-box-containing protein
MTGLKRKNIKNKPAKIIRYLSDKTAQTFEYLKTLFPKNYNINPTIDLLTTYTSDTIYRLNYKNMNYEYMSPSIYRLLGYSDEEVRKINFRDLIIEAKIYTSSGTKDINNLEELASKREQENIDCWEADYLVKRKDGNTVWVSDTSYPWYDGNRKVIGSVGFLRDINSRVNAENIAKSELIKLANTDPLTKLANRRYFFDHLELELKRAHRSGRNVSVLLLDLDHFKNINDTYGHVAGDEILIGVSKSIKSCLRETDIAARLGGEEFGIFLPDTSLTGAYAVAERICSHISKHEFNISGVASPIKCTVSIGVSCSSVSQECETNDLYKMADSRLYIAKNTGRNQVSIDEILSIH